MRSPTRHLHATLLFMYIVNNCCGCLEINLITYILTYLQSSMVYMYNPPWCTINSHTRCTVDSHQLCAVHKPPLCVGVQCTTLYCLLPSLVYSVQTFMGAQCTDSTRC
jgi:hypothetical protein